MYSSSPFGFCFLVLLENCIIEADYMCPFVMLEKLQCGTCIHNIPMSDGCFVGDVVDAQLSFW